ncbi:MAG TPA: mechanosensitive ion channel family protein [Anaerolineales bacterium]|nr:mechanosensitive ion channel family protein [Anaerolineales bacterium]
MIPETLQTWLDSNPINLTIAVVVGALLAFLVARFIVARGLIYLTSRTQNKWDDILVKHLRPYRLAWVAPLIVVYVFAYLWEAKTLIETSSLLLITWLVVLTFTSILSAVNLIYESRATYTGVSIQGYLDIGKLVFLAVGTILSVSLITGQSPVLLLSGLGAIAAVLLLIFHDTILALVASIQIAANDLVREGDWIEVPGFNADGDVTNISLHSIKIQNFDKTFTVIPTYKLMDASFKNWRGMSQAGGRRIKRAIFIDIQSIRFCDQEDLHRLSKFDLLKDYLPTRTWGPNGASPDTLPRSTNVGAFMAYIEAYLRSRPDIRKDMTIMVRHLDPGPNGLPLEIYIFSNTTVWEQYEAIQANIFDHLLAVVPDFKLKVFQQPTGDFSSLVTRPTVL